MFTSKNPRWGPPTWSLATAVHAKWRSWRSAAKAAFVISDETEQGDRALLNLGHTFAHAFERLTGYDSERDAHGRARRDDELRLQPDGESPRKDEVADEVDHAPRCRPEPVVDGLAFEQRARITAVVRDPGPTIAVPRGPKRDELYEVASGVTDEEDIGFLVARRNGGASSM